MTPQEGQRYFQVRGKRPAQKHHLKQPAGNPRQTDMDSDTNTDTLKWLHKTCTNRRLFLSTWTPLCQTRSQPAESCSTGPAESFPPPWQPPSSIFITCHAQLPRARDRVLFDDESSSSFYSAAQLPTRQEKGRCWVLALPHIELRLNNNPIQPTHRGAQSTLSLKNDRKQSCVKKIKCLFYAGIVWRVIHSSLNNTVEWSVSVCTAGGEHQTKEGKK